MKKSRISLVPFLLSVPVLLAASVSAESMPSVKPQLAKICTNCHKAEPNTLRGHFDGASFKAKVVQLKIDDAVEQLVFDEKTLVVVNEERKTGDGELIKNNKLKKGHEVKIEYKEQNGIKTAIKLTAKPPVELPADMKITTAELEKLVVAGPEKGKYFLFDSRPAPRFQEGTIATAVNLPYPAFDKLAEKLLPADKNALLIFFCSGVTCNMSPASAQKAQKLGYKNIKVYKEGMPEWAQHHYGVLSVTSFKEAFLDKDINHVLLDARKAKENAAGFISGAVAFPASEAKKLAKELNLAQKKAPVIVYDAQGGKDAAKVATDLVAAGYGNVKLLTGGFEAWKKAGFAVASGKPAAKAVYVVKLRQGEIDVEEFKKIAAAIPANTVIIDVRNADETSKGMIKGAVALPLVQLRERAGEIPRDKQVLLQCNTGTQAEMAYNTLKELGFTNHKYLNAKVTFEKDGSYRISKD
jgi:rhodanese-related sulfurtransferase